MALRLRCCASPSFSGKASNGYITTSLCRRCSTSRTKKMAKQVKLKAEPRTNVGGTAVRVKTFGGLLEQSLRALAIECLPGDLPDRITVDVSQLNIGDSIHVRDIQFPSGVTPKVPPDLTAFSVLAPVVEEEAPVAEAEAAAAGPEVITEKKEEGEAAAPATGGKEKAPKEKEQKK